MFYNSNKTIGGRDELGVPYSLQSECNPFTDSNKTIVGNPIFKEIIIAFEI